MGRKILIEGRTCGRAQAPPFDEVQVPGNGCDFFHTCISDFASSAIRSAWLVCTNRRSCVPLAVVTPVRLAIIEPSPSWRVEGVVEEDDLPRAPLKARGAGPTEIPERRETFGPW